eukprot:403365629
MNLSPPHREQQSHSKQLNILKQNTTQKLFTKNDSTNQVKVLSGSLENEQKTQDELKFNSKSSITTCGDQIIGTILNQQMQLNSLTQGSTQFNHQSKFFLLDQPLLQNTPVQVSSQRSKKGRMNQFYQGINSGFSLQQNKIPTIQEWFQSLSKEDKTLSLTLIDQVLVNNIVRMQQKIAKKGPGKFKLQTCIKKFPKLNFNNEQDPNQYVAELHQEFKYSSMKALIKDDKNRVEQQAKLLHEKEFLDMVRLTYTKLDGNQQNSKDKIQQIISNQVIDDQLNTLTVSQQLIQDPLKFYQLIQSIVGATFLKVPIDIDWDVQRQHFVVKTPSWFVPYSNNSLANWIIFYFEISLWIHYEAYVRPRFRGTTKDTLDSTIFIPKNDQILNLKNDLSSYWSSFVERTKTHPSLMRELAQEIQTKMERSSLIKPLVQVEEPLLISQLNGGLIQVKTTPQNGLGFNSDQKILDALMQNKDPENFFNELCLVSMSKLGSQIFQMEKALIDIIKDRKLSSESMSKIAKSQKNHKKKNKKKARVALVGVVAEGKSSKNTPVKIKESTVLDDEHSKNIQEQSKQQESLEIREEVKSQAKPSYLSNMIENKIIEESESDDDEDDPYGDQFLDFYSNQAVLSNYQQISRSKADTKNDLINELLSSDEEEKVDEKKIVGNDIIKTNSNQSEYQEAINQIQQIILQKELEEKNQANLDTTQVVLQNQQTGKDQTQDQAHEDLNFNSPSQQVVFNETNAISPDSYLNNEQYNETAEIENPKTPLIQKEMSSPITDISQNKKLHNNLSQTTKKKQISKCDIMLNKRKDQSFTQTDLNQSIDDSITNFEIIRSNKNFQANGQSSVGNNNNKDSSSNQNNLNKKKKKKRSKAVLPQQSQSLHENLQDKSQILNAFMRNIVQVKETEQNQEQIKKPVQQISQEDPSPVKPQPIEDKKQEQQSEIKSQTLKEKTFKEKPVYIRKQHRYANNEPIQQQVDQQVTSATQHILNQSNLNDNSFKIQLKQHPKTRIASFNKSHESYTQHNNANTTAKNTHQPMRSQKVGQRFESFNNQRELQSTNLDLNQKQQSIQSTNLPNTATNISMGNIMQMPGQMPQKEKKKKSQAHKSNLKKKQHYKSCKTSGIVTPQEYPIYDQMKMGVQPQYFMGQHQMMNQYQMGYGMQHQQQQHHMHFNQQMYSHSQYLMPSPNMNDPTGFNQQQQQMNNNQYGDMFSNLADPRGIQYLQQLIHQAMQQNGINYAQQPQYIYNPQDIPIDPYTSTPQQDNRADLQNKLIEQFYDILETEMNTMVVNIDVNLESVKKERDLAICMIESIIRQTFNQSNQQNRPLLDIRMYGSMASKLAIEESDVDLAIIGLDFKGIKELQIKEMRVLYEQLMQVLKAQSTVQFIETATIPVIKLRVDLEKIRESITCNQESQEHQQQSSGCSSIEDQMRYLGVDITFEDSSMNSLYSSDGQRINLGIQCISYIQQLCAAQAELKPIVLFLKKLLQNNSLNEPYHGGLNSYSLILMTSAFLHKFSEVQSVSKNLVEFLRYFGYFFDPETVIVDCQDFLTQNCPMIDPMTVIDPLNKVNNTTRSAFRIKEVQDVFKRAYTFINHKMFEYTQSKMNSSKDEENKNNQEAADQISNEKEEKLFSNIIQMILERESNSSA